MAKEVKLTQEELDLLKNIQNRGTALRNEMSDIGIAKLNLKNRELQAEAFFNKTLEVEKTFAKELEEKYGIGSVDVETGTFKPLEEK